MSSMSSGNRRWNWLHPRCVVCAIETGAPVCAGCEADFSPPQAPRFARCAAQLETAVAMCSHCIARAPSFDSTLTLADYVTPVSGMVGALKCSARLDLADVFGRLLATREPLLREADLVLAAPPSHERESVRGFNQSRQIAKRYARQAGIALWDGILLRVRHLAPQQSLAREARQRNVRGAFVVTGDVRGQRVVVVDDVMTTDSPLVVIASVLKRARTARVMNRLVARTP
jgi:ComF family protein